MKADQMNDPKNILANNIKFLRKSKGLSQEQLANALNTKRSNIAAYEAKNVEPRLRILLEMAKLFNIDLQLLLEKTITDSSDLKEFGTEIEPNKLGHHLKVENADIKTFIDKSIKIRKIFEGFKAFYAFKQSKIEGSSTNVERIMFDIENFISLMEQLLVNNESVIKAIFNNPKVIKDGITDHDGKQ